MIDQTLLNRAIELAQRGLGNIQDLNFKSEFLDEILFGAQDELKTAARCIEAFRQELSGKFGDKS